MPLERGSQLGPYEILSLVGKGGMGEVYRARDIRLDRTVAVKVSQERFTDRFEREARAVAALNHANICTLHDVGPNYLVFEFVEGTPLAGPLPVEKALEYARQILDALDAAHHKGVTHRDLKPGNILVTKKGVKLLDFGLAKLHREDETLTIAGAVMGTPAYMAPEQWQGKPADARSDIYGFGCVLYEMLTGKRVSPQREPLPHASLETIVKTCLENDPEDRWQTAHDVQTALKLVSIQPAAPPPAKGKRALWLAAATLAVLALVALALVYLRQPAPVVREVRSQIPKPDGLTFNPGTQATISPDGQWLAFPALGPDNVSRMYLRSLDSLEVRPLQGSEGIIGLSPPPFWSWDSRFVVYGAQGKLKKSEVTGTPAQVIADTGQPFVQGGTWSRDGVIIYARNAGNLMQVSAAGGTPVPLTVLAPGEAAHRWPQFLPDGKRFLYLRVSTPDKTGTYVGSLDVKPEQQDTSQPLVLTNRQAWWVSPDEGPNLLLVQREESLLAQPFDTATLKLTGTPVPIATDVGAYPAATAGMWSVARNGALTYRAVGQAGAQMFWRDQTGRMIGEPLSVKSPTAPAVSPDGGRIAFRSIDAQDNQDIWIRDLTRGNDVRLTFDPGNDTQPVWSPDGKRIAFAGQRGGILDLYEKNADGSGEERLLLKSGQNKRPTSWSRDGKFLLFESEGPKTRLDLWILPLDGGKPVAFLDTEAQEQAGVFSPDGRWVAYASDASGLSQIYVRPFSVEASSNRAGPQWMASINGGYYPQWSGDSKALFYCSSNGDFMAVDIRPGVTFQAGAPRKLFSNVNPTVFGLSLAADKFLFVGTPPSTGPVPPFTLVLNWTSRLKN